MIPLMQTQVAPNFVSTTDFQHYPADAFPTVNPIHWLTSHFAVGGWSPLQRLSGMLTAHMTQIAPRNGFTWHPHRGLEIYTWVIEGELYHEDTTGGKGIIKKGEIQRMFAGEYIEHQELNLSDEVARVIQIWFVADFNYQGLPPHYQQVGKEALPIVQQGDATHYRLIGNNSPLQQHMQGRLTAGVLPAGGTTTIEAPEDGEDLFFYVTDGRGEWQYGGGNGALGQYDVFLARPTMGEAQISAYGDAPLEYLAFYLPSFIEA